MLLSLLLRSLTQMMTWQLEIDVHVFSLLSRVYAILRTSFDWFDLNDRSRSLHGMLQRLSLECTRLEFECNSGVDYVVVRPGPQVHSYKLRDC